MPFPNRHFSPTKLILDRKRHAALMLNPKVMTQFTRTFMADGYRQFHNRSDPSEGRYGSWRVAREMPVAPATDYIHFLRNPGQYQLFGFVRNPFARLVSAYKNKFHDIGSNPHQDTDYPRSVRQKHIKRLRRFAGKRGLDGAASGSLVPFDTFLHYAVQDRVGRVDHHWCPQVEVLMTEHFPYKQLFLFETEREIGFRTLAEAFGFDPDWATERLGSKRNVSKPSDSRFFSKETLQLAQPLWEPDITAFTYDPDSWQHY